MALARSTFAFSIGTLFSRVTGLARDATLTGVFGATSSFEAFIVANRIPNLFRDMLAEGALGSAFTKVYSELGEKDALRARALVGDAFRLGLIATLILSALGLLLAPWMVSALTLFSAKAGRPESFYADTVLLTRILFPYLGIAMLSALAMGVLHQRGRFFITALAPAGLNIGYIVGAIVLAQMALDCEILYDWTADPAIVGLAAGVLLGGLLHFGLQFYWVWCEVLSIGRQAKTSWLSPDLVSVFTLMAPAAVASSTTSINVLINTNFATSLETGAVTWLNYAFRLLQLPVGVFAVAVGAVSLPALTRAITKANQVVDESASRHLQNAIEFVLWLMVPCFIFLLVNHQSAVELLYQHGRFDEGAAFQTGRALFAYSFAVMSYGLNKVLTAFYFAVNRTSYAMKVSLCAVGANIILNILLIREWGHVGLAAATAGTLCLSSAGLFLGLRRHRVAWVFRNILKTLLYLVVGGALAWLAQRFCLSQVSDLDLGGLKLTATVILAMNGVICVAVFACLALARLAWSPKDVFINIKKIKR